MQIKLWGVRGSLPSPLTNDDYHSKIRGILTMAVESGLKNGDGIERFIETLPDYLKFVYGGNTTCAAVTSSSGKTYIIDCGSGIRPLGYEMMTGPAGQGKGQIPLFITHNHWDHLQGLPFFTPLYIKGNVLHFYSPFKNQEEYLHGQMSTPYFPATFEGTASTKEFTHLDVKNIRPIQLEDDLIVEYHPLKHPGGSFAYRFKQAGKTFTFATDAEFTGEVLENAERSSDIFFKDADLLVIDSQYTLDESFMKFDWGHTSFTMAVNCAIRWKVKTLVLTHHEPAYSDHKLFENYHAAIEHRSHTSDSTPVIFMAREGMVFEL